MSESYTSNHHCSERQVFSSILLVNCSAQKSHISKNISDLPIATITTSRWSSRRVQNSEPFPGTVQPWTSGFSNIKHARSHWLRCGSIRIFPVSWTCSAYRFHGRPVILDKSYGGNHLRYSLGIRYSHGGAPGRRPSLPGSLSPFYPTSMALSIAWAGEKGFNQIITKTKLGIDSRVLEFMHIT